MFNLGDILQFIMDRFYQSAFSQTGFVRYPPFRTELALYVLQELVRF